MNGSSRVRLTRLPDVLRLCLRQVHGGKRKRTATGFQWPEGHGEKIWVFSHRRSEQIIYSFKERLDGFHDLKQLPYNGKKTKPAKLRKDYWSPMAKIEFPAGFGDVGRSAFQKLRELKHLHEVSWSDDILYKQQSISTAVDRINAEKRGGNVRLIRSKSERGQALNAQKANSIADIAAVLAGQGEGNKVLVNELEDGASQLVEVTVRWANNQDKGFAETWSTNVRHSSLEPSFPSSSKAKAVREESTPEVPSPQAVV